MIFSFTIKQREARAPDLRRRLHAGIDGCLIEVVPHRAAVVLLDDLYKDGAVGLGGLLHNLILGVVALHSLPVLGYLLLHQGAGIIVGYVLLQPKVEGLAKAGCFDSFPIYPPEIKNKKGISAKLDLRRYATRYVFNDIFLFRKFQRNFSTKNRGKTL